MKKTMLFLLLLASMVTSQSLTAMSKGTSAIYADSLYWGHARDSSASWKLDSITFKRDSAGTWVTADSCSRPFAFDLWASRAVELEVRTTSSTSIPDSQTLFAYTPETRYCGNPKTGANCDGWSRSNETALGYQLPQGYMSQSQFPSPNAGRRLQTAFGVVGGNSMRICADRIGVRRLYGDTTYHRKHTIRAFVMERQ